MAAATCAGCCWWRPVEVTGDVPPHAWGICALPGMMYDPRPYIVPVDIAARRNCWESKPSAPEPQSLRQRLRNAAHLGAEGRDADTTSAIALVASIVADEFERIDAELAGKMTPESLRRSFQIGKGES